MYKKGEDLWRRSWIHKSWEYGIYQFVSVGRSTLLDYTRIVVAQRNVPRSALEEKDFTFAAILYKNCQWSL